MLTPSALMVRLALAWLVGAIAASIWKQLADAWIIAGAALGVLALADLFLAARRTRLQVRRQLPASAPLYVWIEVRLHLSNPDRMRLICEAFDHYPPECLSEGLPRRLAVPAGGWVEFGYRLRPTTRGDLHFGPLALRVNSPLSLWQRRLRISEPS